MQLANAQMRLDSSASAGSHKAHRYGDRLTTTSSLKEERA
jgi:hypothetical protein